MDEVKRLAMRRKHAERSKECACGRRVYGNGRLSHFRACASYLTTHGYPLNEGLRAAIRDEYGVGVVGGTEKVLGAIQTGTTDHARWPQQDLRAMPWRDFRDLVWEVAAMVAGDDGA